MEQDPNIEWDTGPVVNAGIRDTPIVTKAEQPSFQQQLEAEVDSTAVDNSFAAQIERIEDVEEKTYKIGTGNQNTDRYVGATLGTIQAKRLGTSVYSEISNKIDSVATDPNVGESILQEMNGIADDNVKNSLAAVYETDPDAIQYVYDNLKKWRLQYGPGAFERVTEDELQGLLALKSRESSKLAQERILVRYGQTLMAKRMDETGIGDKVWDFVKAAILPGNTIAMGDFLEKFDPSALTSTKNFLKETVGRAADLKIRGKGFEAYKSVLDEYWNKSPEERLALFNDIEEHINEVAGQNVFIYSSMMAPFFDREAEKDLKLFYDIDSAFILAYAGGKAGKLIKQVAAIRNSRKPVQILIETGNVDKAAEIINKALADVDVNRMRKVTGMDYEDVASSSHALNMQRLNPEQIQGAAAEAASALEKEILERVGAVDKAFTKSFDPAVTPRRFYFDEAAKMELQRKALAQNTDYTTYAEIVSRTEDGFVMEVTKSSDKYFLPSIINPRKYDLNTRLASNRVLEIQKREAQAAVNRADDAMIDMSRTLDEVALKPWLDEVTIASDRLASIEEKIAANNQVIKELTAPPVKNQVTVKYGFDEFGNFEAKEIGRGVSFKLNSPEQTVGQLSTTQVGDATLAEFNQAQIMNRLSEAGRTVFRGLTPSARKNVDQILQWGDEMGRTFSIPQLIGGVDTRFGRIQLKSTQEVAAYQAARKYFDNLHRAENYLRRRNLEIGGFKELELKILSDSDDPIKVFAKRESGTLPTDIKRIYDHKNGKIVDVDAKAIEKRLAEGEVIVNFRQGHKFKGANTTGQPTEEIISYGIIREGQDLKPISGKVLNYRTGYVPKVRPQVAYVVQRTVEKLVNGNKGGRVETVRFFDNEVDANKWRLAQTDASSMRVVPDKRFRTAEGNDFSSEFDNLNFGGLYSGERSNREILSGLDGVESQRVSAYKTIQMYSDHIAARYSSNELKMSLIGKFQNTFGEYLSNPANWRSPLKAEFANDLRLSKSIEAQRAFIDDVIRVPDSFQQSFADWMRGLGDSMASWKYTKGMSGWVMRQGVKDPVGALRNATFHQYLGFFNPAQLLVQAFGAATAMAAYPGKALKLLPQNLALRAAWWDRANPGMVTKIAEYAGMKKGDLQDIVKEIEKVGLFDSLKSTADYAASVNGVSMSRDALKRALDAGLVFMREGEMTSRGYGYLLARDLFLSKKPKGYKITDKDLDAIARDSTRFTMNLNRANRAWWQKGLLSIPTQFWQISAKFTEAMVAGSWGLGVRKWTPAEKGKILLGYLGMFGAGGVPFGQAMLADAMNAYKNSTNDPKAMTNERINPFNNLPEELRVDDQTFARLVKGGLVQVMANWLTGADPNLTSRVSIPAGVIESIEMYGQADNTTMKLIGGAALPGLTRYTDAALGLYRIWAPRADVDLTQEEWRQAVMEVAGIMSTSRNASKALWWDRIGYITDKNGKQMFPDMEKDEFNSAAVWQALGFSPANIGWMYDLEESVADLESRVEEAVTQAYEMTLRYAPTSSFVQSQKNQDAINARINLIIADLTDTQKEQFYKKLAQKELDNKGKITELMLEAITKEAEAAGEVTPGMLANPLLQ